MLYKAIGVLFKTHPFYLSNFTKCFEQKDDEGCKKTFDLYLKCTVA